MNEEKKNLCIPEGGKKGEKKITKLTPVFEQTLTTH